MTTDGKALTRVCVIDFDTGKCCIRSTGRSTEPNHRLSHPVSLQVIRLSRTHIIPNPSFSGITAAAPDPVVTNLTDARTHVLTLIILSTILLGDSRESDLPSLKLSHSRCIDIATTRPTSQAGTDMAYGQVAWLHNTGSGARGTISKRICVHG